jgi:branched-chain amino acid transport system substrate-binding protein
MTRKTLVLLGALLLAACGGGGGGGGSPKETGPIKIGFLIPLSGTFAANGKNEQNGWNLAVQQLGDTVAGRKIEVHFADTQTDPNVALTQARQLVESENVVMLEGPIAGNEIAAVATFAGPKGVPVDDISLCAAVQLTNNQKYGNSYASDWNCDQPSLMAGQYVYDQGFKHVTVVGMDYAFGWIALGGFMAAYQKAGGKIDKAIWGPLTAPDWTPFVSSIPRDTQAVFALMAGAASTRFTNAYKQLGLVGTIPLFGNTTLTDYSALPSEDPNAILGIKIAAQYCDGINSAENKKFTDEYFAKYNTYPGYYSDAGYTKYRLLYETLKKLNGQVGTSKNLVKALKSTPIVAPRGPVSLNASTSSPIENIYICQVQSVNGVLRNVPIKTYPNVKPWGLLSESEWRPLFEKNSAGRP